MVKSRLFERLVEKIDEEKIVKITSEDQLVEMLSIVDVHADHTGPFGENKGALVTAFDTVNKVFSKMDVTDSWLDENGFEDEDDFLDAYGDVTAVVLDSPIGQSGGNFYLLDAFSVEDLDLYYYKSEYTRAFGM